MQALINNGTFAAWYTLENGPVAEILFAKTTDTKMLEMALAANPALTSNAATLSIWSQWLGKGVVK